MAATNRILMDADVPTNKLKAKRAAKKKKKVALQRTIQGTYIIHFNQSSGFLRKLF
jgi:hypothetical protein